MLRLDILCNKAGRLFGGRSVYGGLNTRYLAYRAESVVVFRTVCIVPGILVAFVESVGSHGGIRYDTWSSGIAYSPYSTARTSGH